MSITYNSNTTFALITYYPKWYQGKLRSLKHTDKIRGDLALEFIKKTIELGYRVVISDGKSPQSFRKIIASYPGLILINRRSSKRSVGRRQAIKKATGLPGVKVIVSTEPEKISLLDSVDKIIKPLILNKADIVIPERNILLFRKTYPSYMFESEIEGNKLYNETLRTNGLLKDKNDFDLFFGPRLILNKPAVVKLFTKKYHLKIVKNTYLDTYFDQEEYSSTQFFPIVVALKKKFRIKSVLINFTYPDLQKQNEEKGERSLFEEKRKNQKMSILIDLLYFLNSLRLGQMRMTVPG